MAKLKATRRQPERVFLVSASANRPTGWTTADSLAELGELAQSAGARVVGSMTQRLKRQTHTYLGQGKLEQLSEMARDRKFDTVVCDDELTPTQQRNLEDALEDDTKVIDRTALILDVFARRAQTREGRLQVELAQHEYLLPRVAGQWSHLERQRGGMRGDIGARAGPGETQIETDRRLVRKRVQKIKKDLENVRGHRARQRARRSDNNVPVVSLLGYTNAGKSTLLNSLTGADVLAEHRLFSTLDPVTRQVRLPSGRQVLLSDTVGFIQKLPPLVVAAFRATLEEISESALILHVVDFSHPNADAQTDTVEQVLRDLDLASKPRVLALNKIDLVSDDGPQSLPGSAEDGREPTAPPTVMTSALTGAGLDGLLREIEQALGESAPVPAHVGA